MKKHMVLVAGRSGQVARELVRTAPGEFEVVALGSAELDIRDPVAVRAAVSRMRPSLVVNAAAYTAVDQAEQDEAAAFLLNAAAPGCLAEASASVAAPIIHLSTDYVFDGSKSGLYTEEDIVAPLGVYGRSKLAGEQGVSDANPKHMILRTAWVYSPFGRNFVKTMLRLAEARREVSVVDDQVGNPTAASDIARGVWKIADHILGAPQAPEYGVYHMTGAGQASWAEFAEALFRCSAAHSGPVADVRCIPSAEYPTPVRRPANSRLDCAKIADRFGVVLPEWQTSIETCVAELIRSKGWQA